MTFLCKRRDDTTKMSTPISRSFLRCSELCTAVGSRMGFQIRDCLLLNLDVKIAIWYDEVRLVF